MQTTAELKNGFKETEIGVIPEDWKLVTLGQVSELIMGQSPPSSVYNTVGNGLPFFQGKAEFGELYPTPSKWCSKPIKIAKQKDVLVSVRAPVGDVNIAPFECCIGRGLAVIRTKTDLDSLYLFYYLVTAKKRLESEGRGTTFKAVGRSVLENFKLPLPQKEEQQKISLVLSKIQQAIEQQDKIIKTTKNLKKSLMQKLFTEGIGHTEFKDSEIGQIPKSWEVKPLIEIATLQRGKDLPKQNQIFGKYPIVGSSGILGYHREYFCEGPGIVTGRSGSIGKLTYVKGRYWAHNTGLYVKNFHGNNSKFVFYLFHLLDFKRYATGVSVPTLNRNFIHAALLPIPPLPEQQKIAEILNIIDSKIETEEKRKHVLQQLFKTMLSKLMTGEIRVKNLNLGVYDVN